MRWDLEKQVLQHGSNSASNYRGASAEELQWLIYIGVLEQNLAHVIGIVNFMWILSAWNLSLSLSSLFFHCGRIKSGMRSAVDGPGAEIRGREPTKREEFEESDWKRREDTRRRGVRETVTDVKGGVKACVLVVSLSFKKKQRRLEAAAQISEYLAHPCIKTRWGFLRLISAICSERKGVNSY